jgi:ABC-type lipoprotein export system ATPase subunit
VPAPDAVVRCRGLGATYGSEPALVDVDASFATGRFSVIAGPSGSGKSTFLRVLAGLHRPSGGSVVVDGVELTRLRAGALRRLRRRRLGFVLQSPADNLVEHLTALEQLELAARLRGSGDDAHALLDAVGLGDRGGARPAELSGGEQQRVAFAAAAIGGPTVLLADEPTAQLDEANGAVLLEAMRRLVERGVTIVASSHDHAVIDDADHVVHLRDGRVVR